MNFETGGVQRFRSVAGCDYFAVLLDRKPVSLRGIWFIRI